MKHSPLIKKLWAHFVAGGVQMPAEIPADCTIYRTYAGPNQKDAGAWSWFLWSQETAAGRILMNRGSQYPATAVARAKNVSCYVSYFDTAELVIEAP